MDLGGQAKGGDSRSRSESESEEGAARKGRSSGSDPKPGELPMARVKRR